MKIYQYHVANGYWCDLHPDLDSIEVAGAGVLLVRNLGSTAWTMYHPNEWRVKPTSMPGYDPDKTGCGVWFLKGDYPSWIVNHGALSWVRVFTDGSHRVYHSVDQVLKDVDFDSNECFKVRKLGDTA